jgi:hypothetical protein
MLDYLCLLQIIVLLIKYSLQHTQVFGGEI